MRTLEAGRLELVDDVREAAVAAAVDGRTDQNLRRICVHVLRGEARLRATGQEIRYGVGDAAGVLALGLVVMLVAHSARVSHIPHYAPGIALPLVVPSRLQDLVFGGVQEIARQGHRV